jgi:hypothetical protein
MLIKSFPIWMKRETHEVIRKCLCASPFHLVEEDLVESRWYLVMSATIILLYVWNEVVPFKEDSSSRQIKLYTTRAVDHKR